ncbi:MAG TPA: hypothetical protein PKE64_02720 [Anaerolineae bacterium]|nr:hypothetical protein [Anaerolineae bacterium]HMR62900.1 hypothetical protein [Anaerolineae bacterium]
MSVQETPTPRLEVAQTNRPPRVNFLLAHPGRVFDWLEEHWESPNGKRNVGTILVVSFIMANIIIELNRLNWLPADLAQVIPTNHLVSIQFAFNLLLVFEVISLVFSLAHSVAVSVGKQFEVLSLILVSNTFKEFAKLGEPLTWQEVEPALVSIIAPALGALLIFVVLGFYYRLQQHQPITTNKQDQVSFVAAKKLIALLLLISFIGISLYNYWLYFTGSKLASSIFEIFYTTLIFSDILIVLFSLRYSSSYQVAFRNSGFTVATILIRIALIAPVVIGSMVGVGTALFALGVTMAYNAYVPELSPEEGMAHHE